MGGGMTTDRLVGPELRERLQRERGRVQWSDLRAHNDRMALFLVVEVDLLDVAVAVAEDDTIAVQGWIDGQQLVRPSRAQLSKWQDDQGKPFDSVVVQPYVLATEVAADEAASQE